MYFADEITLVDDIYPPGADDLSKPEHVESTVFCDLKSALSQDYRDAEVTGHRPELVAVLRLCDYSGQTEAVVDKRRLSVFRTYRQTSGKGNPDLIELHLEEKVGIRESRD